MDMVENDRYQELLNDLKEADMLLIGVGNELSAVSTGNIKNMDFYKNNVGRIDSESAEDFTNTARYLYCRENHEIIELYNKLYNIIKDKNYFIVTTNCDAAIFNTAIDSKRVVAPCGNLFNFQCDCDSEDNIVEGKAYYEKCIEIIENDKSVTSLDEYLPRCEKCNKKMYPNSYKSEKYNESGYMSQWEYYNKWLQGSLNKKLLILELGEGFNIPNIIRWPFERIAYLNHKAKFYRVNEIFPQLDEKIGEKGVPMHINTREFLRDFDSFMSEK